MACRPFILLASLTLTTVAHAVGYNFVTIDTPGTDITFVQDINDSGRWVGYTQTANAASPVGYVNGGVMGNADGSGRFAFDRSGAFSIGASGIDSSGAVSGVSISSTDFAGTGFVRSPGGAYTDVIPTGTGITSAYSEAIDLNDNGTVVGFYNETVPTSEADISLNSHGFILQNGLYTQIDAPMAGAFGTQLYSVNDAGTVTGRYLDLDANGNPVSHGFLYHLGTGSYDFFASPSPFTDSFEFDGLNGNGDFTAIAYLSTPAGQLPLSYIYSGGTFTPFSVPGALATVAYGLNDSGQVVGVYATYNPSDPTNPSLHGFTATPVPGPSSFAAFGVGALGVLRRRREKAILAPRRRF